MAITKLSKSSISSTGSKSSNAWDKTTTLGSYWALQTIIVGSGDTSSINFTNIPQEYTHLQLRIVGKDSRQVGGSNFYMTFNNDASAAYTDHGLYAGGSGSATQTYDVSATSLFMARISTTLLVPGNFGIGLCDILDYTNQSKYKTTRHISGFEDGLGNGQIYYLGGIWANKAPISSIQIVPVTAPIKQFTQISLYGIK
jgi:hypothetical protein